MATHETSPPAAVLAADSRPLPDGRLEPAAWR